MMIMVTTVMMMMMMMISMIMIILMVIIIVIVNAFHHRNFAIMFSMYLIDIHKSLCASKESLFRICRMVVFKNFQRSLKVCFF